MHEFFHFIVINLEVKKVFVKFKNIISIQEKS